MRRKYRHKVTGFVREYEVSYAKHLKSLEPVEDSVPENVEDCGCEPEPDFPDMFIEIEE